MEGGADCLDDIAKTPIVIDNVLITQYSCITFFQQGSGVIKAGFGGEEKPALVFNSQ